MRSRPARNGLKTKIQLELLKRLREQTAAGQGFTLIELMIVVAIVGLLAAVSLPNFLGARTAAAAGAAIGEIVGLTKECATFKSSGGIGVAPTIGTDACTTAAQTFTTTWSGTVDGVKCLGVTSAADSEAAIAVSTSGQMTCTLS